MSRPEEQEPIAGSGPSGNQPKNKARAEHYQIPLASGLIAGEAINAILVPVLVAISLRKI